MTVGGGLDHDFDGFFDHGSFGYVDEETVFEIGRIQGYEGVGLVAGVAGQVLFDGGLRKFGYSDARGGLGGRRRQSACPTWLKVCAGNGGHTGETPVFVVRGGEAQVGEALPRFFSDLVDHAASPSIPT
jgi:hypothetical protein